MSGIGTYFLSSISNIVMGTKIPNFPYTIGELVMEYEGRSMWSLYNGTKNDDKSEVSIFVFKGKEPGLQRELANNGLKRLKTLRHPDYLLYIGSAETPEAIYVATEKVYPFSENIINKENGIFFDWGLYKLFRGLRFLNKECRLVHGNVQKTSIFLTKANEWKLGGFDLVDSVESVNPRFAEIGSLGSIYSSITTPEVRNRTTNILKKVDIGVTDAYQVGKLINQLISGKNMNNTEKLKRLTQKMVMENGLQRMNISDAMDELMMPNGALNTIFVQLNLFMEEISVKTPEQIVEFVKNLNEKYETIPQEYMQYKVLPELLKIVGIGGGDIQVIKAIIRIGKSLKKEEYEATVTPKIIEMFGSNDRKLRYNLLRSLNDILGQENENMSGETLVKGVFSNYLTGFQDMSPAIREETAKASILFAKHLGEKAINGDLIRNVSRLGSSDPEPGIRANSLVCIGKLSNQLTEKAMQYIVTPVLLTALKDQFPPARVASLKVIIACSKKIDAVELVRKVIPMICQLLLDSEKSVREAARGTINVLLGIVDEYCKKLPDTTVPLANTNTNKSTAGAAVAANGSSGGGAAKQDGLSAAIQNKLVETVTEGINWWGGSGSSHADVDTSIKADTDSNVIADTNTSTTENKDTSKNSTAGLKPMSLTNKKPAINKTFEYNSYGDDAFGVQENKQGAQDLLGWNENLDFELDFEPIDKPIASPTFPVMTPQQKPLSSPMQSSHNTGNKGLGGSSILDKFILDQQKEEMEKKTRVHSQPPFQQTQQQQGPRSGSMGLGMGMGMGMGLGANANGTNSTNSTNSPSTGPGFGFGSIGASSSTGGGGGSSSRKKKMGAIKLNK